MKFRSRFEAQVALALNKQKIKFEFEPHKIGYVPPPRVYIPDFYIKDYDFYIEVKGRLLQADRVKHLLVKKQNPDFNVKFLFANSRKKIYKGSKTVMLIGLINMVLNGQNKFPQRSGPNE